jgi:hypothetical protein
MLACSVLSFTDFHHRSNHPGGRIQHEADIQNPRRPVRSRCPRRSHHRRREVIKGGWFIGGQGGSGTLVFQGRRYPITIGGISAGLVFGGSVTRFRGTVTNIRRASDVAGVYGAAGAGGAAIVGAQIITMRNEKGAILRLSGQQIGLQLNLDLSGLAISVR